MTNRRDILIGGACVAATGLGWFVTPRGRLDLTGKKKFAQLIPTKFPGWVSHDATDLSPPVEQGSLSDRLYDELVQRIYTNQTTGDQVMVLIAHGPQQTQELMLHRPEVCYPANGYVIGNSKAMRLDLGDGVSVPARRLTAESRGAQENIIYFTRMGEDMPLSDGDQRKVRYANVLHGYVSDGVLARFSIVSPDMDTAMAKLKAFIPALVLAMAPGDRRPLIGTSRAAALKAVGLSKA